MSKIIIQNNNISKVIATVSHSLNIPISKIKGNYRKREYTIARHIAIGLVLSKNTIGVEKVGKIFNRNHSSIVEANKIFKWVSEDPKRYPLFAEKLNTVISLIN